MNLSTLLSITSTKELNRALGSLKEFFYFDVHVFNSGSFVVLTCTNRYLQPNPKTWNGYNRLVSNDYDMQDLIEKELNSRQSLSLIHI